MSPVQTLDLAVNGLLLLVDVALLGAVWARRERAVLSCLVAALLAIVLGAGTGAALGHQPFAILRGVAWALFAHGPGDLVLAALLSVRVSPVRSAGLAGVGLAAAAVGVDAFFVEPRSVEVNFHVIETPKVKEPLRIAILADVQTDHVGDAEWAALEAAMEEDPDLILLAGDYVQVGEWDTAGYLLESEAWKDLIERTLEAPLGVYAVRGNAEWRSTWSPDLFGSTGMTTFRQTASVDLGPIVLTGLSFFDSFAPDAAVDGTDDFHVVLGHGPDFSLSEKVHADLLIAGHTHGGQVQLPFFGPLLTYSAVPRSQAAGGLFELSGGRHLLVSRGVGMEREYAPRLRFLCRPEIVIVDLVPPGWDGTWPGEE